MKRRLSTYITFLMLSVSVVFAQTKDIGIDTGKIDEVTGAKGVLNLEERVFKVSFPRTDVKVTVDGWPMKPFMGKGLPGPAIPAESSIDGSVIEKIIGVAGQANSGMFKVVIGRKATMPCGCDAGKEMGVNTWAAFAGS